MRRRAYRRTRGWAALPLAILLLSGCGTATSTAVVNLVEPTATAVPTATPVPTATATVLPTATVAPTRVPPTATLANTPTPTRAANTPTPRPSVAPTGTRAVPPLGGYVANWATWENGLDPDGRFRRTYQQASDEYRVQILEEDQEWSFFAPEGLSFQDFTLEVEANRVAGPDTIGYGLVFRRQARKEGSAASERYIFYVTPQGATACSWSMRTIHNAPSGRSMRPASRA